MIKLGLYDLDSAFDLGGVPGGSLVEIYGSPDSSKTSLALWYIRHLHHNTDRVAGWVGTEYSLTQSNIEWAQLDTQRLLVIRQNWERSALITAIGLIEEGTDLVVIDSIAALVEDNQKLSEILGEYIPKLKKAVEKNKAVVIMTNQERNRCRSGITTSSGNSVALMRNLDYRIRLRNGEGLFKGGIQKGVRVHFDLVKNGPDIRNWGRTGRFNNYWGEGLYNIGEKTWIKDMKK